MVINIESMGVKGAIESLQGLKNIEPQLDRILKNQAREMDAYAQQRIRAQADSRDVPFAPLAESTIENKQRRGKKSQLILTDSGHMRAGIIARATHLVLEFGDNLHYLIYHQYGTKRMPRRAIFPINESGQFETMGSGGRYWRAFIQRILAIGAKPK